MLLWITLGIIGLRLCALWLRDDYVIMAWLVPVKKYEPTHSKLLKDVAIHTQ